jgi:outer membrane protein
MVCRVWLPFGSAPMTDTTVRTTPVDVGPVWGDDPDMVTAMPGCHSGRFMEPLPMLIPRRFAAMLFAAILFGLPTATLAQQRIAYFDSQRVLYEIEEAKAVGARLQRLTQSMQKEIDAEQSALRKEKELIERQAGTMSEAERRSKAMELQARVVQLAQKAERSRAEIDEKEKKEMEPIRSRIKRVLEKVGEKQGLAIVFDSSSAGVAWAQAQYDLTNEVIREYNLATRK